LKKISRNKDWVLWIPPAKPYEPHLLIDRNSGRTRHRTMAPIYKES